MRAAMGGCMGGAGIDGAPRHSTLATAAAAVQGARAAAEAAKVVEEAEAASRLRRALRYVAGLHLSPDSGLRVLRAMRACGHTELSLDCSAAASGVAGVASGTVHAQSHRPSPPPVVFGAAFRLWLRDPEHALLAAAVVAASLAVISRAKMTATLASAGRQAGSQEVEKQGVDQVEMGFVLDFEGVAAATARRMHALLDTALATAATVASSAPLPRGVPGGDGDVWGGNIGSDPWRGLDAMAAGTWLDDAQVSTRCSGAVLLRAAARCCALLRCC